MTEEVSGQNRGGRPQKWGSDAERKAAKRDKERQEAERAVAREEAIERGAKLGADEAWRRGEIASDKLDRIARAKMYAAWEFDGKPAGRAEAYQREFGVKAHELMPSAERPAPIFIEKS